MIPQKRREYAQHMFAAHPELFPSQHRAAILDGVIQVGITPFEARLAGGAFRYIVTPDTTRWSADNDPYEVMWAQSTAPAASLIWMTCQTGTQFRGEGPVEIHVRIEHGRVLAIERSGRRAS